MDIRRQIASSVVPISNTISPAQHVRRGATRLHAVAMPEMVVTATCVAGSAKSRLQSPLKNCDIKPTVTREKVSWPKRIVKLVSLRKASFRVFAVVNFVSRSWQFCQICDSCGKGDS